MRLLIPHLFCIMTLLRDSVGSFSWLKFVKHSSKTLDTIVNVLFVLTTVMVAQILKSNLRVLRN